MPGGGQVTALQALHSAALQAYAVMKLFPEPEPEKPPSPAKKRGIESRYRKADSFTPSLARMREIASQFELSYPLSKLFQMQIQIQPLPYGSVEIWVHFSSMPNRDTGESMAMLTFAERFYPACGEERFVWAVERAIRGFILHEYEESLHFCGSRILDPHSDRKLHSFFKF